LLEAGSSIYQPNWAVALLIDHPFGAAVEVPDLALRAVLTYSSCIEHLFAVWSCRKAYWDGF
jgi:hypothetical protein